MALGDESTGEAIPTAPLSVPRVPTTIYRHALVIAYAIGLVFTFASGFLSPYNIPLYVGLIFLCYFAFRGYLWATLLILIQHVIERIVLIQTWQQYSVPSLLFMIFYSAVLIPLAIMALRSEYRRQSLERNAEGIRKESVFDAWDKLEETETRASDVVSEEPDGKWKSLKLFFGEWARYAGLALREKDIFVFALLQVAVIMAGYYLFVAALGWIPQEIWNEMDMGGTSGLLDLALFVWGFLIIIITAFPLGLLSGAMGATYSLEENKKPATFLAAIDMALSRAWSLWIFQIADSYITVRQIMRRIPKRKKNSLVIYTDDSIAKEVTYYAWKVATMGIVPSVMNDRNVAQAADESLTMLFKKPGEVLSFRIGYSIMCWIVGILGYIGAGFFMAFVGQPGRAGDATSLHTWYVWAGVPLFFAVAAVMVLLRPFYLFAASNLYAQFAKENNISMKLHEYKRSDSAIFVFGVLLILFVFAFIYADKLGIVDIFRNGYSWGLNGTR